MSTPKSPALTAIHSAASAEWYTPPDVVHAARVALGGIDLDPASCPEAQAIVGADRYYGRTPTFIDGLTQPWEGRVFNNPPGTERDASGKVLRGTGPGAWWRKLLGELDAGRTSAAIWVAYSIEQVQQTQGWGGGMLQRAVAVCFPSRRIRFWRRCAACEGTGLVLLAVGGSALSCAVCDGKRLVPGAQPTHASAIALLVSPRSAKRQRYLDRFCGAFPVFGDVVAGGWP